MCGRKRQRGFTLIEVLAAIGVLLILASAVVGVGRYVHTQAQIELTRSVVDVVALAAETYYDFQGDFPFEDPCVPNVGDFRDWLRAEVDADKALAGYIFHAQSSGFDSSDESKKEEMDRHASIQAAWYYLYKLPESRRILETLDSQFITNQDEDGQAMWLKHIKNGKEYQTDMIRVIDPWGHSLQYRYDAAWAAPKIFSPGPDGNINTEGDNIVSGN